MKRFILQAVRARQLWPDQGQDVCGLYRSGHDAFLIPLTTTPDNGMELKIGACAYFCGPCSGKFRTDIDELFEVLLKHFLDKQ